MGVEGPTDDPEINAQRDRQMRNLESDRNQLADTIAKKRQHMAFSEQQEIAKRSEEGQRELERDIKGWSPELKQKLGETAKAIGFRPEELAQVSDPRAVKLLHKAYLYDQLMAKSTAKPKPEPQTPVVGLKPRASTAITDPDKLPADEWRKWRENQLAAARKKR